APPTVVSPVPAARRRRPPWPLIIPAGIFTAALVVAVATVVVFTTLGDGGKSRTGADRTSPAPPNVDVPDGYRLYRGSAFVVAVPKGWEQADGDDMTFMDQREGVHRGVNIRRVSSTAARSPADALADRAAELPDDPDYPGYEQESLKRGIPYRGGEAAELQFTFAKNGISGRMRVRAFEFDDAVYQASLVSDQEHWDESVPHFETLLRTLRSPS
ncbi:hypothetical protein, partial [Actinomadura sp. 7K507]|uniref:hypothetical protein n=1 Tax=Actinomadura sp. 7K507 TaxID=2530365 RepID=UPI001A9DC229